MQHLEQGNMIFVRYRPAAEFQPSGFHTIFVSGQNRFI